MNRRAFLANISRLGAGTGVVAIYPATALKFLERIFHRPKTAVVVDWAGSSDDHYAHLGSYDDIFRKAYADKIMSLPPYSVLQEHINFHVKECST